MKVVTVHRGSRDGYQLAAALQEAGMLEALVTDLYWPADRAWTGPAEGLAGTRVANAMRARYSDLVSSRNVHTCPVTGSLSHVANGVSRLPFEWRRKAVRWCDRTLGRQAGILATERDAALLSYSYYGHAAFSNYQGNRPRILFQMHPHPTSVRNILRHERNLHPECASSLVKEWELALPENDYQRLIAECGMADYWIAASSFTKSTLVEHGVPAERISVVPYGIDCEKYLFPKRKPRDGAPLKLLFVGSLSQRKGIKYLIQALKGLPSDKVELTICGRPVDDMNVLRQTGLPIRLLPSIDGASLLDEYRNADVFVFPSLAEGFAQVLLEAMASGLPVISTDRTAAPDLIRHGIEGYLIKAGSYIDLREHIELFLDPDKLRAATMGAAARRRAETFTWSHFRHGIVDVVKRTLTADLREVLCSRS